MNVLINKKKQIKYKIWLSLWCLVLFFAGGTQAFAAVTEGKPGETVSGEYAVIVNTSTTSEASTGTLVFDSTGNGSSVVRSAASKDVVGQDAAAGQNSRTVVTSATSSYAIGTEKTITSGSSSPTYVCIGEGEHCYIWMSKALKPSYDAAGKTEAIAKDMARTYDGVPYQMLSTLAGGTIPCQDNTGKLSILLETLSGASGVYRGDNGITAIHINVPEAASYQFGNMQTRNGLLVHEGQHALFHLLTGYNPYQPYLWLNEGLAVAAMDYIWGGTDSSGWLDGIAGNTDIRNGSSLFYQSYRESSARDYGMPYLFVRYLIARKTGSYNPMALFPLFYKQSANCDPATYVTKVLGDGTKFSDLLTEFYTAIIAQEPSGKYGFAGDAIVYEKVKNYPLYMGSSGSAHTLPPTGAIAIRLQNGTFTVPSNGGSSIRYMIIGEGRKVSSPAEGDGSSQNPYKITSFRELNLIGSQPNAHYRLEADIAANGQLNLTITNFRGVLEGNGHVIRGLRQPLIGRNSGTVRNLTIEAAFDGEYSSVQGVFAQINEGLIADCIVRGEVTARMLRSQSNYAETAFGGIAGLNNLAGIIRGCGFAGTLHVELPPVKGWVGGIAGIQMGTAEKCYNRGSLVVTQPDGAVHASYNSGSGDSYDVYVGGIAGEIRKQGSFGGSLSYCVHSGKISISGGNQAVGQLCGLANENVLSSSSGLSGHLTGCYARQNGMFAVGYPAGQISEEGMLLSEEAAKDTSSYQGWDFTGDWKMDADGPVRIGADDIQSLAVSGCPAYCYVGEKPYSWGRLLVNGGSGIQITEDMISGFTSKMPGNIQVKVTYLGKSTSFSMEIRAPKNVSQLQVASSKNRIYNAGEYFDPGSVYLLATIDGMPYRIIYSGFDYNKKGPLTTADTSVLLSYYGASAAYPITVKGKEATGITVTNKMGAVKYQEGQKLDLSEVRVRLTYNNGEQSAILGPDQFEAYGIRVAKASGGTVTAFDQNGVLRTGDHNSAIYVYVGDILPGTYGTVAAHAGTVTVWEKLKVPEMKLHVVSGKAVYYLTSEIVTGGSGNYTTQMLSESLPPGITRVRMPGERYGYFEYRGTTSAAVGSVYRSTYRITDTMTGMSVQGEVEIQVHGSNEAVFYRFDLPKTETFNQTLKEDVKGIIGDHTITLRVPVGTDVSNLTPIIDYGYDYGASLPQQFWSGSCHDFRTPVVYTLTAPDGTTKKQYTVFVEFVPESEAGTTQPDGNTSGGSGNTGGGSCSGTGNTSGGTSGTGNGSSAGNSGVSGSGSNSAGNGSTTGGSSSAGSSGTTGGGSSAGSSGTTGGGSSTGSSGTTGGGSSAGNNGISGGGSSAGNSSTSSGNGSTGSGGTTGSNTGNSGTSGGSTNAGSGSSVQPPAAPTVVYPAVGKVVKSGGAYYRITASRSNLRTVELKGLVKKKTSSLKMPSTIKIDGYSYRVTGIGKKAFQDNKYLKKITISKYVTGIGTYAFKGCKKLTEITLPQSIQTIGDGAFYQCTELKKVTAGKSLKVIGKSAFQNCKNLRTLTLQGTKLRSVGKNAVKGMYKKAVIRVPKKSVKAYQKLFHKKTGYVKSMKIRK